MPTTLLLYRHHTSQLMPTTHIQGAKTLYFQLMPTTYIYDTTECPDSTSPVLVLLPRHVLGQAAGHYDDIISYLGHLLDGKVHQTPQGHIFRLEKFCHSKECLCGFGGGQMCTLRGDWGGGGGLSG